MIGVIPKPLVVSEAPGEVESIRAEQKLPVKSIKQFLWTIPFLSFLLGYTLLTLMVDSKQLSTPTLIGKQLQEALKLLAGQGINARIVMQKEDNDLPEGTILSQTPLPGSSIKINQAVLLVVSKKQDKKIAPHFVHKALSEIQSWLDEHQINGKCYQIPHSYPDGTCIGQLPHAGQPMEDAKITLYISAGNKKPVLMPSLNGLIVNDAAEFLKNSNITLVPVHSYKTAEECKKYIITEQKPLPGSLLDLDKPLTVYVRCTMQ